MFENEGDRKEHAGYYLPKVEITDYNVMIDGKHFFDQSIKRDLRTYGNIQIIATGQEDDTQMAVCWIIIISINTIKRSW